VGARAILGAEWAGAVAEAVSRITGGRLDKVVLARDLEVTTGEALDVRWLLHRLADGEPAVQAGTPLMEIVTEPDLETAEEAFAYLRTLQMILVQRGVSFADMEKGQMRCDVNISLRRNASDPLGAKVELKNLKIN
jgi:Asp-tRNA(Asn)/Glu-tRNA(Gln) amidotransferase B subunit